MKARGKRWWWCVKGPSLEGWLLAGRRAVFDEGCSWRDANFSVKAEGQVMDGCSAAEVVVERGLSSSFAIIGSWR